jgi:hypothetical protein
MEEATPLTEFKIILRKFPGYSWAGSPVDEQLRRRIYAFSPHLNCRRGGHDDVEGI